MTLLPRTPRRQAVLVPTIVVTVSALGWLQGRAWLRDPAVPLLVPAGGADWIVLDEPFQLRRRKLRPYVTTFRKRFEAIEPVRECVLELRAFRLAALYLDGALILEPHKQLDEWKEPLRIDLGPLLAPGPHELRLEVMNENAPPALCAFAGALGVRTGGDWEASADQETWTPARPAGRPRRPALALELPTTLEALSTAWPILLAAAAAGVAAALRLRVSPSAVRWGLLWAWALLGANDILKLPSWFGFDAMEHLQYIRHVARDGRIPLASEGWQMFQSPLYYLLSAPLHSLLAGLFEEETAARLLRIVPIACGAMQVQLAYAAARRVFPAREDLQKVATVVGALLPMNLYLSLGLGNEPLAACLSGALLVVLLDILARPAGVVPREKLLAAGLLLGLALLAKATAVLLVPVAAAAVAWNLARGSPDRGAGLLRAAGGVAMVLSAAVCVAGWYYARNWMVLGKPFIGGWDPSRGIVWWQDPGYRTPGDVLRFGEALVRPVHAAAAGLWDGLYSTLWTDGYLSSAISVEARPPWNYSLMVAGAILALVPTAAVIAGAASAASRRRDGARAGLIICAVAVAVHVAALLALFVALPVYSTAKATYLAGLTPAIAVLAARGLDLLPRGRRAAVVISGALAAWGAAAYGAYFVL